MEDTSKKAQKFTLEKGLMKKYIETPVNQRESFLLDQIEKLTKRLDKLETKTTK